MHERELGYIKEKGAEEKIVEKQKINLKPPLKAIIDQELLSYKYEYKYEKKKWLYYFALPLMWALTIWVALKKKILKTKPKVNSLLFDKFSPECNQLKKYARSWRALNIVYNYDFKNQCNKISNFWLGMINAQAVRNRLELVKRELSKIIIKIAEKKQDKEIRLLSIACGSAEAVIDVLSKFKNLNMKAVLLDNDPSAIKFCQELAKRAGIYDKMIFLTTSTRALPLLSKFRPHIIEMIGFLDYRPAEKAVRLIRNIRKILMPDGIFITGNTCPNPEQFFLKWVIDWEAIYRKPKQFLTIIKMGGFKNCRLLREPHKVQMIAICS
ncbi:MAG: class I SAM-dependent methyltransferase [Promethearchaeota archaeon]